MHQLTKLKRGQGKARKRHRISTGFTLVAALVIKCIEITERHKRPVSL